MPIVSLANAVWLGITGITDAHGIYWTADLVLTAAVLVPLALRWRMIPRPYLVYVIASVSRPADSDANSSSSSGSRLALTSRSVTSKVACCPPSVG